jgi:DNA-binding NarL/FixJ family response regulator
MMHLERLTPREHEVLSLLSEGRQNKEIADALTISEGTVESHLKHIYVKLQVNNRTEASVLYLHNRDNSEST